jgi:hypothetical protein
MKNYANTVLLNQVSVLLNVGVGLALLPFIQSWFGGAGLLAFGTLFGVKSFLDIGIGWINSGLAKKLLNESRLTNFLPYYIVNGIFCGIAISTIILVSAFTVVDLQSALYFSIYVCTIAVSGPLVQAFIGDLKQHCPPTLRISQQLTFCGLILCMNFFGELKAISDIFLALSISALMVYIAAHIKFRRMIFVSFDKPLYIKSIILEARPFLLTTVSTVLLLQLDFFLIMSTLPETEAAHYYVIWKLASSMLMFGWRFSEPYAAISRKTDFKIGWPRLPVLAAAAGLPLLYLTFGGYVYEGYFSLPDIPTELIVSITLFLSVNSLFRYYYSVSFYTKYVLQSSSWQMVQVVIKAAFILLFLDGNLYILFLLWAATDAIGTLILLTLLRHENEVYTKP